jgi:hypothetical protein
MYIHITPRDYEPVIVTDDELADEDTRFALALVSNAEYIEWVELMDEARRYNEDSALQLEASIHDAQRGNAG